MAELHSLTFNCADSNTPVVRGNVREFRNIAGIRTIFMLVALLEHASDLILESGELRNQQILVGGFHEELEMRIFLHVLASSCNQEILEGDLLWEVSQDVNHT